MSTSNNVTQSAAPVSAGGSGAGDTWFAAMAEAWGKTLDGKAQQIEDQAKKLSGGENNPSVVTELTALALEMRFLSSSSHTQLTAVGSSLETMARKG
jgi:hypothetical protein